MYTWLVYLPCIPGLYTWLVYLACIPALYTWLVYLAWPCIPGMYTWLVHLARVGRGVCALISSPSLVSTNTGCSIHDEGVQDVTGGGDSTCEEEEKLYQPE